MARDDHRCVNCGNPDGLVVHHLVAHKDGGEDVSTNCVTLCRTCHGLAHSKRAAT